MRRPITILALAALLVGCSSSVEPEEVPPEMVGVILGLTANSPAILVPQNARVGEPILVTIETWWRNSCAEISRTAVQETDGGFIITPYEIDRGQTGVFCLQMPETRVHSAGIEFDEPGIRRVTIQGRHVATTEQITPIHRFVTVVD